MKNVEIIVAACVGIIAMVSYAPMEQPTYASFAIVTLCLISFVYYKLLSGMVSQQSCQWSIALLPLPIPASILLASPKALTGAIAISIFLLIRSVLVYLHNRKLSQRSLVEDLLDRLQKNRIDFTNGRVLQNEEIRKVFLESFTLAQREIDIISPWINRIALNQEAQNLMEDALKRSVRIRIIYGITGTGEGSRERQERSKVIIDELSARFQQYGTLFGAMLDNTHEKLLLCDETFMMVSSFNLLSFDGKYGAITRKEMMYYIENPNQIRQIRNAYFSLG